MSYTYDGDGNTLTMTDSTGTTSYTYNALNQETQQKLPSGATTAYTWDGVCNLLTKADAGGTVTYAYTADDQLSSVTEPSGANITLGYDVDGNETSVGFPSGVTESLSYNTAAQLTQIQAKTSGGTVLTSYSYSYTKPGTSTATVLPKHWWRCEATGPTTDYIPGWNKQYETAMGYGPTKKAAMEAAADLAGSAGQPINAKRCKFSCEQLR